MGVENAPSPESQNAPVKKPFYKKPLGCCLGCFGGLILFFIIAVIIGAISINKLAPSIAADIIKAKSGFTLTVAGNDTNIFAGRVDFKGVKLENPDRFTEKSFVNINQVKTQIDTDSLKTDTIVIPEIVIDIKELTFVGKEKFLEDNNVFDIRDAFIGKDTDAEEPETKAPAKKFLIKKLVLKLDTLRAISKDGTDNKELVNTSDVLDLEFTDVTQDNLKGKVIEKITPILITKAPPLIPVITQIAGDIIFAAVGDAIDTAKKAVENTAELIKDGGKAATEAIKDVGGSLTDLLGGRKNEEKK